MTEIIYLISNFPLRGLSTVIFISGTTGIHSSVFRERKPKQLLVTSSKTKESNNLERSPWAYKTAATISKTRAT